MAPSIWQILIVAVLVVLLFGRGKISGVMGDVAKGIKSFKKGMQDDDTPSSTTTKRVGEPGDDARDVTPTAEKKDA
ncbi:MAG: twin-arginine translocase TatA/TatE family subunit [Albimonas sp.]|mgnify:FL=1|uniref:twin-arginine translocase TatA/TatE family subunit n=1 Tax=Albimonas sp. TaxID=1872425 RepID=UPI00405638DC|tara:strand:- start:438 stop:665 length:228 start_codon:yes stop_codon:yes gene_type:complete